MATIGAGAAFSRAQFEQLTNPTPHARLGINLSAISDWGSEHPFVDMFRASRLWISQRQGAGWGLGPQLDLDANGWVKSLEPGCWADTPLSTLRDGHYPSGKYTIYYEGNGRIESTFGAPPTSSIPGRVQLMVDSERNPFYIKLRETDPANPVRNIRVIMPGFEQIAGKNPINPSFAKRWADVSTFRFMDWGYTNNSPIQKWSDRSTLKTASWATRGVPLEAMMDLCNRLGVNPWICVPHLADDDYIRQLGTLVRGWLFRPRKVYLEYSNEVWNPRFIQNHHAIEQGNLLGLSNNPVYAGWSYYARRAVQMFQLFRSTFGDAGRMVRVLSSQAASAFMSRHILAAAGGRANCDALAVAPYLGLSVTPFGAAPNATEVESWSLDQLFEYLRTTTLPQTAATMTAQRAAAAEFGLPLIAYEAGQHLAGVSGAENNDKLTELFVRANGDRRMGELFRDYYRAWDQAGGGVLCHYSSMGRWTKWGSWGLLQYEDEDPARSPKYLATMAWLRGLA